MRDSIQLMGIREMKLRLNKDKGENISEVKEMGEKRKKKKKAKNIIIVHWKDNLMEQYPSVKASH
jgi:hypothetical protein